MIFSCYIKIYFPSISSVELTFKHLEMCAYSALWLLPLKHQAISIHSADHIFTVLNQFCTQVHICCDKILENKIMFWTKYQVV